MPFQIDPRIPLSVETPRFNSPFEVLQKFQQDKEARELRRMQIEQQREASQALIDERRQRMETAQREQQTQVNLSEAYKQAFNPETGSVDRKKLGSILTQGGFGSALPDIFKTLDDAETANTNAKTAKTNAEKAEMEYAKTIGAQILAADFNPVVIDGMLTVAESHGHDVSQFRKMPQEQFKAFVTQLVQGPELPAAATTVTPAATAAIMAS